MGAHANTGEWHAITMVPLDNAAQADTALQFSSTNDSYVSIPDRPSLSPNGDFTVEAWVYQTDAQSSGYRIVDKTTAGIGDGILFDTYNPSGNGHTLRLCAGTCLSANTAYSLNAWHHVAVSVRAGQATFYLDGVGDGGGTSGTAPVDTLDLRIGAPHVGCGGSCGLREYFAGAIDDVRLWSVARSAAQVKQDMAQPTSVPTDGLTGAWDFDEGAGTTVNDSSGNGATGTLVNGPMWVAATSPAVAPAISPTDTAASATAIPTSTSMSAPAPTSTGQPSPLCNGPTTDSSLILTTNCGAVGSALTAQNTDANPNDDQGHYDGCAIYFPLVNMVASGYCRGSVQATRQISGSDGYWGTISSQSRQHSVDGNISICISNGQWYAAPAISLNASDCTATVPTMAVTPTATPSVIPTATATSIGAPTPTGTATPVPPLPWYADCGYLSNCSFQYGSNPPQSWGSTSDLSCQGIQGNANDGHAQWNIWGGCNGQNLYQSVNFGSDYRPGDKARFRITLSTGDNWGPCNGGGNGNPLAFGQWVGGQFGAGNIAGAPYGQQLTDTLNIGQPTTETIDIPLGGPSITVGVGWGAPCHSQVILPRLTLVHADGSTSGDLTPAPSYTPTDTPQPTDTPITPPTPAPTST